MVVVDSLSTEHAERARQTVARIRAALDSGKSAGIAQIVELIREVTCKFETISVQSLGEVVGRDLLTMSRVISVAHTLGFNPEGVEISTINQAIHVIGFNKIRNLALSLMLMQNVGGAADTEKRNVAALALVSGLIAQGVRARQEPADAEEAFVCAALRSYGRIMVANFLPEEYRATLAAPAERGESTVYREHFGLTPLELTLALFEQTRMPRNILHGLREILPATRNAALSQAMELPVVADFAEELSRLVATPRLDLETFNHRAAQLVRAYGPNIALNEEDIGHVLDDVSRTLNMFGALTPGSAFSCPLLLRLTALTGNGPSATNLEPPGASAPTAVGQPASPTIEPGTATPSSRQPEPLLEAIAQLKILTTDAACHVEHSYHIALEAIRVALELSHALVFRRVDQTTKYAAWLGLGDVFQMFRGEELLDGEKRDVFSVCLRRGEDVLIQNPADPKIQPFIPDWLRPAAGSQPLILLPVRDGSGTVTVFCGLRATADSFVLGPRQSQQLHTLRQLLRDCEMAAGVTAETADAAATG